MPAQARASWPGAVIWAIGGVLCLLIAAYGYACFTPAISIGGTVAANAYFRPWLLVHIGGAATALLVVPLQLSQRLRRHRRLHRYLGRVYVASCGVGGVAGVVLAAGSSAGPVATAGFGLLGLAWLGSTALGWRAVVAGRLEDHRAWMLRSFALTFAAVTLRIDIPLALAAGLPLLESYRAIAFLCWVPNLLIAELYLRFTASAARTSRSPA